MDKTHCTFADYISHAFVEWRESQGRSLAMTEIETLKEAERKVKAHWRYVRNLETVAEAAQAFIEQCTIAECFCKDNNRICYDDCLRGRLVTALRALEGGERVG